KCPKFRSKRTPVTARYADLSARNGGDMAAALAVRKPPSARLALGISHGGALARMLLATHALTRRTSMRLSPAAVPRPRMTSRNAFTGSFTIRTSSRRALLASLGLACGAAAIMPRAAVAEFDAAAIARAEHESLRASICPAPGTAGSSTEGMFDTERQRMAPAKVFDNLYLLGMKTVTAWALETSEGIILFDAMFHYNVEETVVESMRRLGLDPADIEYVVVTHAHNDHFGAAKHLQDTYGARIVIGAPDW